MHGKGLCNVWREEVVVAPDSKNTARAVAVAAARTVLNLKLYWMSGGKPTAGAALALEHAAAAAKRCAQRPCLQKIACAARAALGSQSHEIHAS